MWIASGKMTYVTKQIYFLLVGLSFFIFKSAYAFDPDAVKEGSLSIVPPGYVGSPVSSSYSVEQGNANMFVVSYKVESWSGDVNAYTINHQCTINDTRNLVWTQGSAATQLDRMDHSSRKIVTLTESGLRIPFRWGNLSQTQKTLLDNKIHVLNYIRGDRSNEAPNNGLNYRARESVLGDIIHSTPLHWKDENGAETLFVGANDGMLHAFDAATGAERFAVIPSQLFPKLLGLTVAPYAHKYFVDGQMMALRFNPAVNGKLGEGTTRSVLVASLGGGSRGLIALDIGSTPTSESQAAQKILWEVSHTKSGFENLGHVYGKPIITRLNNGRMAVIVGNGYNNTGNGKASLIFIDPLSGNKMGEVSTNVGSTNSPNGLSTPTVLDIDFDGKADVAYAGDIQGNLWKFDLSSSGSVSSFSASRLFVTSPVRPITMAPAIKSHPQGGRMVLFATGKQFEFSDLTNEDDNYAYGIWDRPAQYSANSQLLNQVISQRSYGGLRVRTASKHQPDWRGGNNRHYGWRTKIGTNAQDSRGERVVGDGGFVTGNTFIFLTSSPNANLNNTPSGANWWMQINAMTGGEVESVRFDLNRDGKFDSGDQVGNAIPVGLYVGGGTRSQFVALSMDGFDCYQSNYDGNSHEGTDPIPPEYEEVSSVETYTETATTTRGVRGGHFDADVYYGDSFVDNGPGNEDYDYEYGGYFEIDHKHEYDDDHNVTGINFLNPSESSFYLGDALSSSTQRFKILFQNQYLSPAAELHLNFTPAYRANKRDGFVPLRFINTSSTLDINRLPSYTLSTLNSFVVNFPVDAFEVRDWWGGHLGLAEDRRVGLHPSITECVTPGDEFTHDRSDPSEWTATGRKTGTYFQPVIPPARKLRGEVIPDNWNGVRAVNQGARHGGALTVQIIAHNTPQSAIEMSIPGSPEYGWRVKNANFRQYVIAEYNFFYHIDENGCFGDSHWRKKPPTTSDALGDGGDGSVDLDGDPMAFGTQAITLGTNTVTTDEGLVITTEKTQNADGTITIRRTVTGQQGSTDLVLISEGVEGSAGTNVQVETIGIGGIVADTGEVGAGIVVDADDLGRVNWRELRR